MADSTPEERKRAHRTFVALRYALLGVAAGVAVLYAILISYSSKNNVVLSPFVLLIPAVAFSGFGAFVTDKKCPKCGQKFYGKPWRIFSNDCESCGWAGE